MRTLGTGAGVSLAAVAAALLLALADCAMRRARDIDPLAANIAGGIYPDEMCETCGETAATHLTICQLQTDGNGDGTSGSRKQ